MRYAEAGVNIALADQAKQKIARLAARTFTRGVVGGIGAFGALFSLDLKKWKEPLLVSSADGVGTKLKIAFAMGVHSTVGGDLVNHCINDILTLGAEPLFFWTTSPSEKWIPSSSKKFWKASAAPVTQLAARSSAEKPPKCRIFTKPANTISPDSSSAPSSAINFSVRIA